MSFRQKRRRNMQRKNTTRKFESTWSRKWLRISWTRTHKCCLTSTSLWAMRLRRAVFIDEGLIISESWFFALCVSFSSAFSPLISRTFNLTYLILQLKSAILAQINLHKSAFLVSALYILHEDLVSRDVSCWATCLMATNFLSFSASKLFRPNPAHSDSSWEELTCLPYKKANSQSHILCRDWSTLLERA